MAEVKGPTSRTTKDDEKTTSSAATDVRKECPTCHVSIMSIADPSNSRFKLKPGEYMFDFEGSTTSTQSLSTYLHMFSVSNVYRMFFNYTQVLQMDTHRCCTTYSIHGNQNRFNDIPCIEETRVRVKHPTAGHDYIHANWVDGYREPKKFILTQAPLAHTIDQFWNMIWQEKSVLVVSMIQMFDVNGAEWGICYIPQKTGEELNTEGIKLVHCGTRCVRRAYDATILKVVRDGVERKLLHICFFSWGHKGTPRRPTELLNFVSDINFNRELLVKEAIAAGWLKQNETSPLVVHCLSGAARSATLVALDICMKKMDDTASKSCGSLTDVEDVVLRIRTQRAMAMQIPEQYLFLHLAVFEYAVRQRYITDETYAEVGVENYFYEPRETKSEEPEQSSRIAKTPRKRSKRLGPSH